MPRRLNVLIVPDEGGPPRRLHIPTVWLKLGGWALVALFVLVLYAVINYSRVVHKAFDWNRLAAENERLKAENRRIVSVAREVDQSRQILARIVKNLGGHLDLGPISNASEGWTDIEPASAEQVKQAAGLSKAASEALGSTAREKAFEAAKPDFRPVNGFISQKFIDDPIYAERSHRGVDIAGKMGAPVAAAGNGRVIFSGWTEYFGNTLIIAHPGGWVTFYGHNQTNLKAVQTEVKRGETIALLGSTGKSSAPHLHYEVYQNGEPVDPTRIFKAQ